MSNPLSSEGWGLLATALAGQHTRDNEPITLRTNAVTGQPVTHYKCQNRYHYEAVEVFHTGDLITGEAVLIDLHSQNSDAYNKAMRAVTGDTRQMNIDFSPYMLTKFLQTYFDNEQLEGVQMIEYANANDGYPNWLLRWRDDSLPSGHQRKVWVDPLTSMIPNTNAHPVEVL